MEEDGGPAKRARTDEGDADGEAAAVKVEPEEEDGEVKVEDEEGGEEEEAVAELSASQVCTPRVFPPQTCSLGPFRDFAFVHRNFKENRGLFSHSLTIFTSLFFGTLTYTPLKNTATSPPPSLEDVLREDR